MTALPYVLHGTTLALAWFLLLNTTASLIVSVLSALLARGTRRAAPGLWLALRLSPAAVSIGFVAVVFLPSYWRYEPRDFVEGFDISLTMLALAGTAIIATAAVRGVGAWTRAARRTNDWMRAARPLAVPGVSMPAFAIDTAAPVMALVGVLRPRLLVTTPVLDALTAEELSAASAHELGHWRAWDNLKRLAMRAAPDLLAFTPAARSLEHRWAAAAEHAADRGAGASGRVRCALASALVKVARLTPAVAPLAEPISTLVDGGEITSRVQRLLEDPMPAEHRGRARWLALSLAASSAAIAYTPLLRMVHAVTELLVRTLP